MKSSIVCGIWFRRLNFGLFFIWISQRSGDFLGFLKLSMLLLTICSLFSTAAQSRYQGMLLWTLSWPSSLLNFFIIMLWRWFASEEICSTIRESQICGSASYRAMVCNFQLLIVLSCSFGCGYAITILFSHGASWLVKLQDPSKFVCWNRVYLELPDAGGWLFLLSYTQQSVTWFRVL